MALVMLSSVMMACEPASAPGAVGIISANPDTVPDTRRSVTGTVLDGTSDRPLAGARITTSPPTQELVTGADGRYIITEHLEGLALIRVQAAVGGYADGVATAVVDDRKVSHIDVMLYPEDRAPRLQVEPGVIFFAPQRHQNAVSVRNASPYPLSWSVQDVPDWLTLEPVQGTLAAGQRSSIVARLPKDELVGALGLLPGQELRHTLTVLDAEGADVPLDVIVRMPELRDVAVQWIEPVGAEDHVVEVGDLVSVELEATVKGALLVGANVRLDVVDVDTGLAGLTVSRRTSDAGRVRWQLNLKQPGAVELRPVLTAFPSVAIPPQRFVVEGVVATTVDAAASTLTATPDQGVLANGDDRSTITVTVVDSDGQPIAGRAVALTSEVVGAVLVQPGLTDQDGRATGTLASTRAGLVEVVATVDPDGDAVELVNRATVTFVADAALISATLTTLDAVPPSTAPGSAIQLMATVRDAFDNPVAGIEVGLSADTALDLTQPSGPTDADGHALGSVTSALPLVATISAVLDPGGAAVNVAATATVTFAACVPTGPELCDGLDNDCNGQIDDDCTPCDPLAVEVCDGVDNDCNGQIDEGVGTVWYADLDGDDFGDPDNSIRACAMPTNFLANAGDCAPGDAAIHPGVAEVCDGLDNDCNGQPDDGLSCVGQISVTFEGDFPFVANDITPVVLVASVLGPDQGPAATETVDFAIVRNGATIGTDQAVTDASGRASVNLRTTITDPLVIVASVAARADIPSATNTVTLMSPLQAIDLNASSLTVAPADRALADGQAIALFTLEAFDVHGVPIADSGVTPLISAADVGGPSVTYAGRSDALNTDGTFGLSMTSLVPGPKTVTLVLSDGSAGATFGPVRARFAPVAPVITSVAFTPPVRGCASVQLAASHVADAAIDYRVSWRPDSGAAFRPVTLGADGTGMFKGPRQLAAGQPAPLLWDTVADLPGVGAANGTLRVVACAQGACSAPRDQAVMIENAPRFTNTQVNLNVGNTSRIGITAGHFGKRDGRLDVGLLLSTNTNPFALLDQTPAQDFTPGVLPSYAIPLGATAMAVGDIDLDGVDDVVILSSDELEGSPVLLLLSTTPAFPRAIAVDRLIGNPLWRDIALADMDVDGDLDLIVLDNTHVHIVENAGAPPFAAPVTTSWPMFTDNRRVAVADLDHDGLQDVLAIGASTASLGFRLGNGARSLEGAAMRTEGLTDPPLDLAVADLDGDLLPEIVVSRAFGVDLFKRANAVSPLARSTRNLQNASPRVGVADVNGDGLLDAYASSAASAAVEVLYNLGPAGLAPTASAFALGAQPDGEVIFADLVGDDTPDLAYVSGSTNELKIVEGARALGCSKPHPATSLPPLPFTPEAAFAGDLDNDGWPDLAVVHDANQIRMVLSHGGLEFEAGAEHDLSGFGIARVLGVEIADFDGDGANDLFVFGKDLQLQTLYVLYTSDGNLPYNASVSETIAGVEVRASDVADIDHDGDLDVLLASMSASQVVYLVNDGASLGLHFEVDLPAFDARFLDYNADGFVDYAVGLTTDQIALYRGRGDGQFDADGRINTPTGLQSTRLVAEDLDGNGFDDLIAVLENDVLVLRFDDTGSTPTQLPIGPSLGGTPYIADLDGDALRDLVVAIQAGSRALLATAPGEWGAAQPVAPGGLASSALALADFDGDGRDQVAAVLDTSGGTTRLVVDINREGRLAAIPEIIPLDLTQVDALAFGDVDGDGRLDGLAMQTVGSNVQVVTGLGANVTTTLAPAVAAAGNGFFPTFADADHDGLDDLFFGRAAGTMAAVAFSAGDGTFGGAIGQTLGGSPVGGFPVNLDHDGAIDYIAADATNLLVAFDVSRMSWGSSILVPHEHAGVPSVALFDYSNNGFLDAIMTSDLSGDLRLLINTGNSFIDPGMFPIIGAVPPGHAARFVDVTADGFPELLLVSADNSTLHVAAWLCEPGSFGTDCADPSVALTPGEPIVDYAVADLNRDGRPDILILTRSGVLHVFYGAAGALATQFTEVQELFVQLGGRLEVRDLDHDGRLDLVLGSVGPSGRFGVFMAR